MLSDADEMTTKSAFPDAPRLSLERVAAFRLSNHHLANRAARGSVARVAGDMAGVQAQILSAAEISLWARTRDLRAEHVKQALWKDRTLVRVWCMRGTTHLVPSEDFAVFVRGCTRRAQRDTRWLARAGRPLDVVDRLVDAVGRVLDRPLTRKELARRLVDGFGRKRRIRIDRGWGGRGDVDAVELGGLTMSIGGILSVACLRGVACAGPPRGNETTFVRPDAWLRDWKDRPIEEAEDELLRRYLHAHGPATVRDFATWTYMTAADAREIWDRAGDGLAPVMAEGRPAWTLRADVRSLERATIEPPVVRLLPSFDSFLLGQKDKSHLVDPAHYKRVYRAQGWLSPAVLVDGRVAGTWSYAQDRAQFGVRIEGFKTLPPVVRSRIREEAEDLGRFFDRPDVVVKFA